MERSYMPLGGSRSHSEAISVMTIIKDITFDVRCLKKPFERVLEKGNENKW
nr:MAG TPA: RNase adapter protein [Caudoviricetes sp.]